jgi:hypothetical protein
MAAILPSPARAPVCRLVRSRECARGPDRPVSHGCSLKKRSAQSDSIPSPRSGHPSSVQLGEKQLPARGARALEDPGWATTLQIGARPGSSSAGVPPQPPAAGETGDGETGDSLLISARWSAGSSHLPRPAEISKLSPVSPRTCDQPAHQPDHSRLQRGGAPPPPARQRRCRAGGLREGGRGHRRRQRLDRRHGGARTRAWLPGRGGREAVDCRCEERRRRGGARRDRRLHRRPTGRSTRGLSSRSTPR